MHDPIIVFNVDFLFSNVRKSLTSTYVDLVVTDKKVFPKYDVLGWYSTGSDVQDSDMHIHKAVGFQTFYLSFMYLF